MENKAGQMLAERMQRAFAENPRGELYRTLTREKLLQMLEQNIAELRLAFAHENDVEDKLADCGNYLAFLYRNYVDPPRGQTTGDQAGLRYLGEVLRGITLTPQQADLLVAHVRSRVVGDQENLLVHQR